MELFDDIIFDILQKIDLAHALAMMLPIGIDCCNFPLIAHRSLQCEPFCKFGVPYSIFYFTNKCRLARQLLFHLGAKGVFSGVHVHHFIGNLRSPFIGIFYFNGKSNTIFKK